MKTIKQIAFFFLVIILATNCRKDEISTSEDTTTFENVENVKFQFVIANESNQSIVDAQINIGAEIYETDENGIAITKAFDIAYTGMRIEISATGYETLIKMVNGPKDGTILQRVILSKSISNIIDSGSTGEIDGGGRLSLPSTLTRSNGSSYSGAVTVKSKYLNPDDPDFLLSAPGNLLALNDENEYQQLASLGMYLIELFDSEGGKLNVPEGSYATIFFPIANKHKELSFSEIPLWYFDEESGIWVEDGKASVEGGEMVAQVSHFTWWNCDLPYEFTEICLVFLDDEDSVVPGLEVFFSVNGVVFGHAITDANGVILAKVPIGVEIDLEFLLYGVVIGTTTAGPFDENDRKVNIYIDTNIELISGLTLDCDSNIVANGYAYFEYDSEFTSIPLGADGSFFYGAPKVEHTLTIIDKNSNKIKTIEILEEDQNEDFPLGSIYVCDELSFGTVSGHVIVDSDGDNIPDMPLAGVKVWIQNRVDFSIYSVLTDGEGYYEEDIVPLTPYAIHILDEPYDVITAGDKTPEGNIGEESYLMGQTACNTIVDVDEHDKDNDFFVIHKGIGVVSGTVMGDVDNDGIGDVPCEGLQVRALASPGSFALVKPVAGDGTFSFEHSTGYFDLSVGDNFNYLVDWDTSPDPDGDDSNLGSNKNIPLFLQAGELDADNTFVISLWNRSAFSCEVLEDTDFDGIGDEPVRNVTITFEKRNDSTILSPISTNGFGFVVRSFIGAGTTFLKVGIESSEYEIINLIDTSPDNDPFIVDGNITEMIIDVESGEWDAGNIFVVRKI